MTPTPYQVVAPLVSLFVILYAWNLVFRQKKTMWEACLWTVFWGAIAAIAIYPPLVPIISTVTGIKGQTNAVMATFLGILLFMVFYLVIRLEELEQRQTRIVRKLALRDANLDEQKDKTPD
jgi:hypothetical protein